MYFTLLVELNAFNITSRTILARATRFQSVMRNQRKCSKKVSYARRSKSSWAVQTAQMRYSPGMIHF